MNSGYDLSVKPDTVTGMEVSPMQPIVRSVLALVLIPGILLIGAPGARASDSCDLTFYGFSADGKKFLIQEECMHNRTATLKIGTLATGRKVKAARSSSPYSRADVLRHARVRPLRLTLAGRSPGWTVYVTKRGSRFTFELRKGRKRIRMGTRTFRRTRAIIVNKVYWERHLRGVVLSVTIHRGVSGIAGKDLIGFRVKGLAPAARGLMIETIPNCRVLVNISRCMVRVTPASKRAVMRKTADVAINKMERALRSNPTARKAFSRTCAVESGKLKRQFRRHPFFGKCMR